MIVAAFVSNAEISGAWHKRLYNKIAGHAKRIRRFGYSQFMALAQPSLLS